MPGDQIAQVDAGFSAKASEYDELAATHPVVIWMRDRIRAMVEAHLPDGGSILEINAGSGIDAAYFAAKGYHVHATDVAEGMLDAARAKAAVPDMGGRLRVERRAFTELAGVDGAPYDVVFSNLGGLNCIEDLKDVTAALPAVLRPGGAVVFVVMPPVCPWEMAQAARGRFKTAFRRLSRRGTLAHVEGAYVRTWYHAPGTVQRALGLRFQRTALRSFCLFAPPSYFSGFVWRHPRLTKALMALDDAAG
ncbi:MAG TPA: class I SAM-dependent methyltransferase, partial [Dehalococcoidia bacterium]